MRATSPLTTISDHIKCLHQSLKYYHFTFEMSLQGFFNNYTLTLFCAWMNFLNSNNLKKTEKCFYKDESLDGKTPSGYKAN